MAKQSNLNGVDNSRDRDDLDAIERGGDESTDGKVDPKTSEFRGFLERNRQYLAMCLAAAPMSLAACEKHEQGRTAAAPTAAPTMTATPRPRPTASVAPTASAAPTAASTTAASPEVVPPGRPITLRISTHEGVIDVPTGNVIAFEYDLDPERFLISPPAKFEEVEIVEGPILKVRVGKESTAIRLNIEDKGDSNDRIRYTDKYYFKIRVRGQEFEGILVAAKPSTSEDLLE